MYLIGLVRPSTMVLRTMTDFEIRIRFMEYDEFGMRKDNK